MRILSGLLQFVLFLVTFLVGSLFLHPFHLRTTLASDPEHLRTFQWDGVLLMVLLYLLVLLLETAIRQLRRSALGSTIALVLAATAGLMMKIGFLTTDR